MSTIILLILTAFYAYRGWRKGILRVLFGFAGVGFGYFTAYMVTKPLGDYLYHQGIIPGLFSYAGAAVIAFGFMVTLFNLPLYILGFIFWREREVHSQIYYWSGAVLNGLLGCFLGMVVVWGLSSMEKPIPASGGGYAVQKKSWVSHLSDKVVGGVVEVIGRYKYPDDPILVRLMLSYAEDPNLTLYALMEMSRRTQINDFINDPATRVCIEAFDVDCLLETERFQSLIDDEPFMKRVRQLKLMRQEEGLPGFKVAFARSIIGQAQLIIRARENPRFRMVGLDPALTSVLRKGSSYLLLKSNEFRDFLLIFIEGTDGKGDFNARNINWPSSKRSGQETRLEGAAGTPPEQEMEAEPAGRIYKWRDEKGILHFTTDPPPKNGKLEGVLEVEDIN